MVDAAGTLSEQFIRDERKRIADKYLVTLQNYGTVILRANRPQFEKEISALASLVAEFGKNLKLRFDKIIAENPTSFQRYFIRQSRTNSPNVGPVHLDRSRPRLRFRSNSLMSFSQHSAVEKLWSTIWR